MANLYTILIIICLTFIPGLVSGVKFLVKPQNVTLDSSWVEVILNCTVDKTSPDGMDWTAVIQGRRMDICSSISNKCTAAGYSVDRPNDTTTNLILRAVDLRNSSVEGEYCCQSDNGEITPAVCCYVTVTDDSQMPHNDITEANETTASMTTAVDLSTSNSELSPGVKACIGVVVVVAILLVLIIPLCIFWKICPIYKWCRNNHSDGTPTDQNGAGANQELMGGREENVDLKTRSDINQDPDSENLRPAGIK